jgi:hypothetical protein
MFVRDRLTTTTSLGATAALVLLALTACRHSAPPPDKTQPAKVEPAAKPEPAQAGPAKTQSPKAESTNAEPANAELPPKIAYSEKHDAEIKEILALAAKDRWEMAQTRVAELYA